ncbi:uncharacterized protein LOC118487554 [Helianthus annuus]|uniref:uncharacterized protein LOC118487554 n=1 Tax=Helianthus annuus TaxID=4232 RepID=UPI001652EF21|nr:uncharacterized protein LOC118487554 [Helianthus annuus]
MEDLFLNTVSPVAAAQMIRPVTRDEVKAAMFSIADNKAPGLDGYTSVFFKKTWDIVGEEVSTAILQFFENDRIKGILGSLVDINQSAFILGRKISDNILLTQELMHNYHVNRGKPRFGFPQKMVDWIRTCVSTVSFSLSINGNLCGFFKSKRSLRQGDPISPYLFTLVIEVLSLLLHKAADQHPAFRYHEKCKL